MPELWIPSSGVNRKLKELYTPSGGVNRKLKELYAVSGGVNRKIFTAISDTIYAKFYSADAYISNGSSARVIYQDMSDATNFWLRVGIDYGAASPEIKTRIQFEILGDDTNHSGESVLRCAQGYANYGSNHAVTLSALSLGMSATQSGSAVSSGSKSLIGKSYDLDAYDSASFAPGVAAFDLGFGSFGFGSVKYILTLDCTYSYSGTAYKGYYLQIGIPWSRLTWLPNNKPIIYQGG